MEKRSSHPEGPEFSRIITGVWRWGDLTTSETERLIMTSLDEGIHTFDHADIYGSYENEALFGKVLSQHRHLREQMVLITKCGIRLPSPNRPQNRAHIYDTSAAHIRWSVEQSLKNLSTDRIDVLLIHRPDPLTDPSEVAEVFEALHREGKVLHFGVSNFTGPQFRMLQKWCHRPLITNQIELSVNHTEPLFNGDVDTLMEFNVAPMAWSPLAGGKPFRESEQLRELATGLGLTVSQLSLAWLLTHPSNIFPVIGTTKADRIVESAAISGMASGRGKLGREEWFRILEWSRGYDIP